MKNNKKLEQKKFFVEIMKIYDNVEEIIDEVERDERFDREVKVDLIAPIVVKMNNAAEIISEGYLNYVEGRSNLTKKNEKKIENTIRNLFTEAVNFVDKVEKINKA